MGIKHNIAFIKSQFEKEGYKLVSSTYVNNKTYLDYICPNNHKHKIKWNCWQQGNRCPYCYGNVKKKIEELKELFEKEGYVLLSTVYKGAHSDLCYRCPRGHIHLTSLHSWLSNGNRCPTCAGNLKKEFDFVKTEIEKEGYILLTKHYDNCETKLEYICSFGHKNRTSWHSWNSGNRCPTCAYINKSGPKHYNWQGGKSFELYCSAWKDEDYKSAIRKRDGDKCLNPRCNSKNPKDLTIHHINYRKKDCKPTNLITLCRSCNASANFDREWHKSWYKAIIYRRYGYEY